MSEPTDRTCAEPAASSDKVSGQAWAILGAMAFGAFIAQMFTTIINPAMPTIASDLNLSLETTAWVSTAYSLGFGAFLVAGGRLADIYGEVKLILVGLFLFLLGLLGAALAFSELALIASRGVQGLGIGISAPATLSILVNVFPIAKRGLGVGIWGSAHGLGLLVGPLLGGILTEYVSWRSMFWIAIPLTMIVILVTLAATRGYSGVLAPGGFDLIGFIIGTLGISAITYGLENSSDGWGAPLTWGMIVGGVALVLLFLARQVRIPYPVVDLSLWRERLFSGGFFAEAAGGFIYIPIQVFLGVFYFQDVLKMSPIQGGLATGILVGVNVITGPIAGRMADSVGPGPMIAGGFVLQAVGLFWFSTISPSTEFITLVPPLIMIGIGVGAVIVCCNVAGMSAVDTQRASMGSGLMQMSFNISAALGVAVLSSIFATVSLNEVSERTANTSYGSAAVRYHEILASGNTSGAKEMLSALPSDVAAQVEATHSAAQAHAIGMGMLGLGIIALLVAIMVMIVIGRRKTPDHIQMVGLEAEPASTV